MNERDLKKLATERANVRMTQPKMRSFRLNAIATKLIQRMTRDAYIEGYRQALNPREAVECVDSPTGKHVFSPDEEYAQKKHLAEGPVCCEYCGAEP